jgi:Ni/Co efflux regulator RcnB
MKRIAISAFAICVALAVPTALWADDHHDHPSSTPPTSTGSSHGSTGGTTHDHRSTPSTSSGTYHSYQFHSTKNTAGHMTMGHHPVVDVSKFRRNVTAERHFHFRDYHGPADYAYHRWSYGDNLPREYWVQDYWITSFLNFGLDSPPDGYVWVQYGNDALLIDEDTGEIIEVQYGIFY